MKIYAIIDTNVLVSAVLKRDSIPGMIMEKVFQGIITPVYNDVIMAEYNEVLRREKFNFQEEDILMIMENMQVQGVSVKEKKLEIDMPDEKDVVFYEVVMEKRKEGDAYLVTGNIRHFPKEPFIVTPREMLEIIYVE